MSVEKAKGSLERILREVRQGVVFCWTAGGTEPAELRAVCSAGKNRESARAALLQRLDRQRAFGPVLWTRGGP